MSVSVYECGLFFSYTSSRTPLMTITPFQPKRTMSWF